MPLSPRRVQAVLGVTLIASLLGFTLSVVNWVQAENTRDAQRQELELLSALQEVEGRIDANTTAVAEFVQDLREQQAKGPSPATLRLYSMVEEMARVLGVEVPSPAPSLGEPGQATTTTSRPPG